MVTGKTFPRIGETCDTTANHYVLETPVCLWHWLTVSCTLALMVTGYFIGRPPLSINGEAAYLFYMGDIRLVHFTTTTVFAVILLMRTYWAFISNHYLRELFIVPVWRHSWWWGAYSTTRQYLLLGKKPEDDIGRNPIAQVAMYDYFLPSISMILTGFASYSEHSQCIISAPFHCVTELFYWAGGDSLDIHSWYRLGTWFIAAFIVGHIYMTIREGIMSDKIVISTMISSFRSHKFPKGQHDKEAS